MAMVLVILPMILAGCFATRTFYSAKYNSDDDRVFIYRDNTLVIHCLLPVYEKNLEFISYIESKGLSEIYVKDLDLSIEDSDNIEIIPQRSDLTIVSNDGNGTYTYKLLSSDLPDSIKDIKWRGYFANHFVSFPLDKFAYSDIPDSCKNLKIRKKSIWPDDYRFDPESMMWSNTYYIGSEKHSDLSLKCHAVIVRDGKELIIDRKIKISFKKRVVFILNYT